MTVYARTHVINCTVGRLQLHIDIYRPSKLATYGASVVKFIFANFWGINPLISLWYAHEARQPYRMNEWAYIRGC